MLSLWHACLAATKTQLSNLAVYACPYQRVRYLYDILNLCGLKGWSLEYREFLKITLPHLGLRWRRFRSKSIRKRIIARVQALGLATLSEYRNYLLENAQERRQLTSLLTVTISRFWRNRQLFDSLGTIWLPTILERLDASTPLRIWSAGCASGEEPYSLLILWEEYFTDSDHVLQLLASDTDTRCLERASQGCYPASSFREMPKYLRQKYCVNEGGVFSVPYGFSERIDWVEHNLMWDPPFQGNHVIFCRNLVYTYFTEPIQREITRRFHRALYPQGLLVVGRKDRLPSGTDELFRLLEHPIFERIDIPESSG